MNLAASSNVDLIDVLVILAIAALIVWLVLTIAGGLRRRP